jgi:hypothetical protein
VPAQQVGQAGGAGQLERKAGDRVHGHGPPPAGVQPAGRAGDLDDLGGVREPELLGVHRDDLEGVQLDAAVGAVAGGVGAGTWCQGMAAQRCSRVGLLALTVSR